MSWTATFMISMTFAEIPEDEARYWTGKLERINAMGIHDEVRHVHVQLNNSMPSMFSTCGVSYQIIVHTDCHCIKL